MGALKVIPVCLIYRLTYGSNNTHTPAPLPTFKERAAERSAQTFHQLPTGQHYGRSALDANMWRQWNQSLASLQAGGVHQCLSHGLSCCQSWMKLSPMQHRCQGCRTSAAGLINQNVAGTPGGDQHCPAQQYGHQILTLIKAVLICD